MSLSGQLILISLLVLEIYSKFSQSPDHSFIVWDSSKNGSLFGIQLSADDDKLAVISFSMSDLSFYHTIYKFDGSTQCDTNYPPNIGYVGWPSQTSGLFVDSSNLTMVKATSSCANPQYLASTPLDILDVDFAHTSQESYVALAYESNKIIEYNIASGAISRQYDFDNATDELLELDYSPNHDYLYAVTTLNDKFKTFIFDASSGEKKQQIYTDLSFLKGNADGDGFIAADLKNNVLYAVDKDGNKKQIWSSSTANESPVAFCTNDIKIIAMRVSGTEQNPKVEIISYNSDDGSESQTFQVDFMPNLKLEQPFVCNDKYLSIFDTTGRIHIFKYSHSFPVWAIILIVVGSLLIIGGGVAAFIIYKRRQSKKSQSTEYQQFSNEQKLRDDI